MPYVKILALKRKSPPIINVKASMISYQNRKSIFFSNQNKQQVHFYLQKKKKQYYNQLKIYKVKELINRKFIFFKHIGFFVLNTKDFYFFLSKRKAKLNIKGTKIDFNYI